MAPVNGQSADQGQPDAAALFPLDRDTRSGRALYPFVGPVILILMLAAVKIDDALHPSLILQALIWPPVIAAAVYATVKFAQRRSPSPQRGGFE